jgi:hypothetical protein
MNDQHLIAFLQEEIKKFEQPIDWQGMYSWADSTVQQGWVNGYHDGIVTSYKKVLELLEHR